MLARKVQNNIYKSTFVQVLLREFMGLAADYDAHRRQVYSKIVSIMEDVWSRNAKVQQKKKEKKRKEKEREGEREFGFDCLGEI